MLHETDLSRVDLNLLVLFETVFDERHVGRAAGRIHLSPSALSHGLARLRALLGDPLFIRTPKGVVPTDRALQLAGPIAEVLRHARLVLASSRPFEPAIARRRFVIGAPDGVSATILPPLLRYVADHAPGVDLGFRQILPIPGETSLPRAWSQAFKDLETRAIDLAVIPTSEVAPRFHARPFFLEDFVVTARGGHPFLTAPTLEAYCAQAHLVVSGSGDPHGFVDEILTARGLARRVAVTVPDFMFALATLAETDLICALPRRLVALHGERFGLAAAELPLPRAEFQMTAVIPRSAMADQGLVWFLEQVLAMA